MSTTTPAQDSHLLAEIRAGIRHCLHHLTPSSATISENQRRTACDMLPPRRKCSILTKILYPKSASEVSKRKCKTALDIVSQTVGFGTNTALKSRPSASQKSIPKSKQNGVLRSSRCCRRRPEILSQNQVPFFASRLDSSASATPCRTSVGGVPRLQGGPDKLLWTQNGLSALPTGEPEHS
jgi:hypothetical protein